MDGKVDQPRCRQDRGGAVGGISVPPAILIAYVKKKAEKGEFQISQNIKAASLQRKYPCNAEKTNFFETTSHSINSLIMLLCSVPETQLAHASTHWSLGSGGLNADLDAWLRSFWSYLGACHS
jgi:hypothetical protein